MTQFSTQITGIFKCSLERAFKSPMLCDITKVHTGYFLTPRATHCSNDESWGKIGGSRKVFFAGNIMSKTGGTALDTVIDRIENKYWKIQIDHLEFPTFGLTKFVGEWYTHENPDGTISIKYIYTLFSDKPFLAPVHWFVTKFMWRIYMKHVMENVRKLAEGNEPFLQS